MRRRLLCSSGGLDVKSPLYLRVTKNIFMQSNPILVKPDPGALEFDFNGDTCIYPLSDGTSTSSYYEFYVEVDDIKDFFDNNNIKKGDSIQIRCMSLGTGVAGYDFSGNNYTNVLSQSMSGGVITCNCAYLLDGGPLSLNINKDGGSATRTINWAYINANVTADTTGLASNTATVTPTSFGSEARVKEGSTELTITVPKNTLTSRTTHTIHVIPTNTSYSELNFKYTQNAQSSGGGLLQDDTIYIKLPQNYKTQVESYIPINERVQGKWEYNMTPMVSNDKFVMGCKHGTDVFFSKGSITGGTTSSWTMTDKTPYNMVFKHWTIVDGHEYNATVRVEVVPGATGASDTVYFNISGVIKYNLSYRWKDNNNQPYEMTLDFDGTGSVGGQLKPIE